MSEIVPAVANPLVDARDHLAGFLSCMGAAFLPGEFALRFRQRFLILTEEAWVGDELAVGEGQERVQARIKTDGLRGGGKKVVFLFHRKADKPFGANAVNAARFDLADHGTMEFGLDLFLFSKEGDRNGAFTDLEPALRIAEGVVTVAFHAGKAWCFSGLYPAEEGTKSDVDADGDILQDL